MHDIYLTTKKSFINNDGSILLISKDNPEIIEFHSRKFKDNIKADKITFDLDFQRLNTSSRNICKNNIINN